MCGTMKIFGISRQFECYHGLYVVSNTVCDKEIDSNGKITDKGHAGS